MDLRVQWKGGTSRNQSLCPRHSSSFPRFQLIFESVWFLLLSLSFVYLVYAMELTTVGIVKNRKIENER